MLFIILKTTFIMAAPSLMISSASARNPSLMVPVALVLSVEKRSTQNPISSADNVHQIVFNMNTPVPSELTFNYNTDALRDTAFTAIKTAINTALT